MVNIIVIIFSSKFNLKVISCTTLVGGGGVGKSTVINVVARHCDKALKQIGDDPNQPRVIIMAPTGMAACIIGKCNI